MTPLIMLFLLMGETLAYAPPLSQAPSQGSFANSQRPLQNPVSPPQVVMNWNCTLINVMECFAQLVQSIDANIKSAQCQNRASIVPTSEQYRKTLRSTLGGSIPASLSCQNARWTEAMTVAANLVLSRSQACQLDHGTLLMLGEAVNKIFTVQRTCQLDDSTTYKAKLGYTLQSLLGAQGSGSGVLGRQPQSNLQSPY